MNNLEFRNSLEFVVGRSRWPFATHFKRVKYARRKHEIKVNINKATVTTSIVLLCDINSILIGTVWSRWREEDIGS